MTQTPPEPAAPDGRKPDRPVEDAVKRRIPNHGQAPNDPSGDPTVDNSPTEPGASTEVQPT